VQYAFGEISPDGQLVSYAGNDAEPTRQDVLVRNLNSGEVSRVYAGGGFVFPFAWSPDSRSLTAVQFRGNTDHVVYVVPVDGGEAVRILPPGDEPALCLPFAWAPDGSSILVRTDAGREFTGVARYTIATNTLDWILTPDWDVEHAAVLVGDAPVGVIEIRLDAGGVVRAGKRPASEQVAAGNLR